MDEGLTGLRASLVAVLLEDLNCLVVVIEAEQLGQVLILQDVDRVVLLLVLNVGDLEAKVGSGDVASLVR